MPSHKILIADDEPAIVEILGMRLRASGYQVSSAADGDEALAKIKVEKPDLMVLDVLMPKLTGLEVLQKVREIEELKDIPAIMLSARGRTKDFFMNLPKVEFLQKPFEPQELVARMAALLGEQK